MMEWDLTPLYASFDSPEYQRDIKKFEELIKDLVKWTEENLKDTENAPHKVEEFLRKYIEIEEIGEKVGHYAFLTMSVEADNEDAAKYADRVQVLASLLTPAMVRFERFLASLESLDDVLKTPLAKEHEYWLRKRREHARRLLTEKEEEVIAQMKTTGGYSWSRLRGTVTAKLTGTIEIDGEEKELSINALRNMAYDKDPEIRRKAYEAELAAYPKVEDTVASALNYIKGEYIFITKRRGYSDPLQATLEYMHLDRDTFETVMGVIRENLDVFRKYLRHKAKLLGHEGGLPWYDLFAPIGKFEKKYTIDEAKEFILSVFKQFDEELYGLARRAFEEKWIDYTPRKGKRGGAFCAKVHTIGQSRIMANFDGSFDGITTLAHELGHAFHNYNQRNESILNATSPMPIAETASIFNEVLVIEKTLPTLEKDEQVFVLEKDISGNTQVIVDIMSRFIFESEVFRRRAEGVISVAGLKEIMLNAQKEAYGDGLDHEYLHPYMWLIKPHYYSPDLHFYNFPYAFGLLFSRGLYAMYKREGEEFIPKYKELLRNTGKYDVEDIGSIIGVDLRERFFWQASMEGLAEEIERFIALTS